MHKIYQFVATVDACLFVDMPGMGIYGVGRYAQELADGWQRISLAKKAEHLGFARGEFVPLRKVVEASSCVIRVCVRMVARAFCAYRK